MIKKCVLLLIILCCCSVVNAAVWVNGYTRKDGTKVSGHYRSDPDGNFWNNWSTKGNVNPYTGKVGTKTNNPNVNPYKTPTSSSFTTNKNNLFYSNQTRNYSTNSNSTSSSYDTSLSNYYNSSLSTVINNNSSSKPKTNSSTPYSSPYTIGKPTNETSNNNNAYSSLYQNMFASNSDTAYYDAIKEANEIMLELELSWYIALKNKGYLTKVERVRFSLLRNEIIKNGGESRLKQIDTVNK